MGFFQTFWTWLGSQLTGYIGDNTARIATAIEPAVVAAAVVYVMMWGFMHLTGRVEEPFAMGLIRLIRMAVVLGVSLHLWLYNDVIVDTFYRAPAQLASAIIGSSDPVATVDAIWTRGGSVADSLIKSAGGLFNSPGLWIMAFVVWLLIGLLCVYVMFLISLSSIASSVLLAIGPLFVALCLFDSTRRYFEAWVAQLANYALITVLTVLVAALLLQIMENYAAQTAANLSNLRMVDALDMMLMAALVLLLMRQVMPIAAGLAGGLALSNFNAMSRTLNWVRSDSGKTKDYLIGLYRKFDSTSFTQIPHVVVPERGAAVTGNQVASAQAAGDEQSVSWRDP